MHVQGVSKEMEAKSENLHGCCLYVSESGSSLGSSAFSLHFVAGVHSGARLCQLCTSPLVRPRGAGAHQCTGDVGRAFRARSRGREPTARHCQLWRASTRVGHPVIRPSLEEAIYAPLPGTTRNTPPMGNMEPRYTATTLHISGSSRSPGVLASGLIKNL